jgi:hypothetical protein
MGGIIYTSTLIPKASPISRTPRHDDIIYVSGVPRFRKPSSLRN